jgi:hypothetical protein
MHPQDFPTAAYEQVAKLVGEKHAGHADYKLFAGAWNAVRLRFGGMDLDIDQFEESLASYGLGPELPGRIPQERSLYGFFASSVSIFDAAHFALYILGRFISPENFKLEERKIDRLKTVSTYAKAFPDDAVNDTLKAVSDSQGLQEIIDTRNILTHRLVFGRTFHMGGDLDGRATWGAEDLSSGMLNARRELVVSLLDDLGGAARDFAKKNA